jgi:cytoskeletal protein CcmA (bactofilin family)
MQDADKQGTAGLDAHFGPGLVFDGKLNFNGQVRIDGTFSGEITTPDLLIVGETAKVTATINCGSLSVSGEVTGTIRATDAVEMHRPARVKADIFSPSLAIDKGVVWEGSSTMQSGGGMRLSSPARDNQRRLRARAYDPIKKDEPTA